MGTYMHTHIITSFRTKANLTQAKSVVVDPTTLWEVVS